MKITVLGTGTSSGVPVPACGCEVCLSKNPKNSRLRCSIYIEIPEVLSEKGNQSVSILIDTSTDLRTQALRYHIKDVDAVLYTHPHADHTNGIDDLRCFNFIHKKAISVFATKETAFELTKRFGYAFLGNPEYEGGTPPELELQEISAQTPFSTHGVRITPLSALHGKLPVLGYRIGNFAYLTDCSYISEETKKLMQGLEVLILDGLRFRPHKTHFTIEESVAQIHELAPKKAYLTHLSHEVDHEKGNAFIKTLTEKNIEIAWDGLVIDLP